MEIKVIKPKEKALFCKKKVAAYARVSVENDNSEHSLANQVEVYKNLISKKAEWQFVGVYADEAYTGTNTSRPGFQRMLADCNAGKIDIILTKSISRFARNTVDLLNVTRDLRRKGICIRFEREGIDSTSSDGDFLLTLLASFAEAEARSASENGKWAVRKRFEKGVGNSFIIYGYRWDGEKFNIEPEEAKTVRFIFKSYLDGYGPQMIAKLLKQQGIKTTRGFNFSNNVIAQILRCEKYAGNSLLQKTFKKDYISKKTVKNNGELPMYFAEGTHPQIISTDTFEAVQAEIKRRANLGFLYNPTLHFSCFTSKIICGKCGRTYRKKMTGISSRHKVQTYKWVCGTKMEGTSKACPAQNIPGHVLISLTAEILGTENYNKELFDNVIDHIEVTDQNILTYILKNGDKVEKQWDYATPNRKSKETVNGNISNTYSCN